MKPTPVVQRGRGARSLRLLDQRRLPHGVAWITMRTGAKMRDGDEVLGFGKVRAAPKGAKAWNPAFDVTSADPITAIVTGSGVHRPPYLFAA